MTTLHNPAAFASSASASTWVIDFGATDHMRSMRSDFLSYTLCTQRGVRIVDGSSAPVVGKGNITVSPNLSLSSILHVPKFSFNLLYISAQGSQLLCYCFIPHMHLSGSNDGSENRWC